MSSSLSDLLHQFLDVYQREPDALYRAFSEPTWALTEDIPLLEQRAILTSADKEVQSALSAKTLLDTVGLTGRHQQLENEIGDSRVASTRPSNEDILERLKTGHAILRAAAEEAGLTVDEYRLRQAKAALANQGIATELLRLIANKIDDIARSLDELDGETDFRQILPQKLIDPFRECHLNFALGNYGSVCVLCGALLEGSIKDLLPASEGKLNKLIKEAEDVKLLSHSDADRAFKATNLRNAVVHGDRQFSKVNAREAAWLIATTRSLICGMYSDRTN